MFYARICGILVSVNFKIFGNDEKYSSFLLHVYLSNDFPRSSKALQNEEMLILLKLTIECFVLKMNIIIEVTSLFCTFHTGFLLKI